MNDNNQDPDGVHLTAGQWPAPQEPAPKPTPEEGASGVTGPCSSHPKYWRQDYPRALRRPRYLNRIARSLAEAGYYVSVHHPNG